MQYKATVPASVEALETRLLLSSSPSLEAKHHVKPLAPIHAKIHPTSSTHTTTSGDGTSQSPTASAAGNPAANPSGPFATGNTVSAGFVTEAIVSEGNGKLLVIGHKGDMATGQSQGVIERLNSDGSLDTSFANKGQIVGGTNEAYFAAAMQDSKHFIVAGENNGDFVLRRYNLNGTIDTTFGANGTVITDFGTASDAARAIAIGPGGMIVVGGDSGGNFAFAEYELNGQLNTDFAQGGLQLFGLGNGSNGLGAIAIQSDGKIVAAGAESAQVVAVRLTSAGEADGTFGSGGLVVVKSLAARTDLGQSDYSEGLALTSDGGILIANRTAAGHFGLARIDGNGVADTAFGANGVATANFGGDDDADSILVQSSGTILIVGTSMTSTAVNTAVAEFDSAGLPINSFGTGGLLTLPSGFSISQLTQATVGGIPTKALHIGDIVLRAFGTLASDGSIIIGTTNEAVAATTSSTLRRLVVPGAVLAGKGSGTLLGTFGIASGKNKRLSVTENGASVTLSLTGGTAAAYQDASNLDLTIDDMGRGVALIVSTGATDVSLGNVAVSGTLRSMSARNVSLVGTLHVTGSIGRVTVGDISGNVFSGSSIATLGAGSVSGAIFANQVIGRLKLMDLTGTIAAGGGVIGNVWAASMTNARILSGVNLGADGLIGGSVANADTYNAGSIGAVHIGGAITSSFIGAGADPADGNFGNGNDKAAGTGASVIHLLAAKSADDASRFEATDFGQVRLGQAVEVTTDPRFQLLT